MSEPFLNILQSEKNPRGRVNLQSSSFYANRGLIRSTLVPIQIIRSDLAKRTLLNVKVILAIMF